jgi:hypothetical protein
MFVVEFARNAMTLSQKRDCRRTRRPFLFRDGALEEFSEGFAQRKDSSEVVGGEIGARSSHVGAFAADLYHADDVIVAENWRADDFLDDFGAFGRNFNGFENASVLNGGEIVDDFGTVFSGRARSEGGLVGERDEADILERFWNDEVQMPPAMGDTEDGYFVRANRKRLSNAFRKRGEGDLRLVAGSAIQCVGKALQFCHELHVLSRNRAGYLAPGERSQ